METVFSLEVSRLDILDILFLSRCVSVSVGLMLCRDVRRMRAGGEGACVTTLLEMPFGAQR